MSLAHILTAAGLTGVAVFLVWALWRKPPPRGDWYESGIGQQGDDWKDHGGGGGNA